MMTLRKDDDITQDINISRTNSKFNRKASRFRSENVQNYFLSCELC